VQVLLLVWDDTTNNMPGLGPGVMGTSDEKTKQYFKDTEVTCVLCPRQGGVEDSYLQVKRMLAQQQREAMWDR
jgi:phospholipase D1/2